MKPDAYAPLTVDTLPAAAGRSASSCARGSGDARHLARARGGDGNLNLVFIVEGEGGGLVIKQALPYVRLVWRELAPAAPPAPSSSITPFAARTRATPGVPEIVHFDEAQAIIAMEYLAGHIILRRSLIEGNRHEGLGERLGILRANAVPRFRPRHDRGRSQGRPRALRRQRGALRHHRGAGVHRPYFDAPLNRDSPGLEAIVGELRADAALKIEAQRLKTAFADESRDDAPWRPPYRVGDGKGTSARVSTRSSRPTDPWASTWGC